MHIGKKVFQSLAEVSKQERVEREKEAFKSRMFSKVNTWLADFDSKATLSETPVIQANQKLLGLIPSNFRPSIENEDEEQASFRDYEKLMETTVKKDQPLFTTLSGRKDPETDCVREFILPNPHNKGSLT